MRRNPEPGGPSSSMKNLHIVGRGSAVRKPSDASSVSARSSIRIGISAQPPNMRRARVEYLNYVADGKKIKEPELESHMQLRVLTGDQNNWNQRMRASMIRWKKHKTRVALGDGKLDVYIYEANPKVNAPPSETWRYELNQLSDIGYKRVGATDFTLTFYNDDKLLNFRADSAEEVDQWLFAILSELRLQASIFDECATEFLSPKSKDRLKNQQESRGKNYHDIVEENVYQIETCLREAVDLWILGSGTDDSESCKARERLARWLEQTNRAEEATYWLESAEEGWRNYNFRLKQDLNPLDNPLGKNQVRTALDEIRNPADLSNLVKHHLNRKPGARKARKAKIIGKLTGTSSTKDTPVKELDDLI